MIYWFLCCLKVSANVKENISAAKEEVKETFKIGKEESSESVGTSDKDGADVKDDRKASSGKETYKQTGTRDDAETFFGKFKSSIPSSKVSLAFQRLKEAKVTDFVKKGYDVVKDDLYGNPNRRKHLEYTPPPSFKGEMSTRTDIVVLPSKQSQWSKKNIKEKVFIIFVLRLMLNEFLLLNQMQGHPLFKRFVGFSKPVIAQDMQERWETSDNPIVHKIQESFSLMDFVAEVQEAVRPVINAYIKGDLETLKKYCCPEVITLCEAEQKAFQSHDSTYIRGGSKRDQNDGNLPNNYCSVPITASPLCA
ncbi:hypothetical protein P3X46_017785 [Hevea brasiliensis]|uniref:Tim44-like domain-containing protein n=1 Tax=Hevea brasiliensis TaxID=3981 RepID=A0ABQ9LNR1_HEVBR|nr:hypothetical protein P3X46_017785 [Hevea brasiliensis]